MGQTEKKQPTAIKPIKDENKGIVYTMLEQIKHPNLNIYFSWGAKGFTMAESEDGEPCLIFKVNGRKFKGYVFIFYDWSDWYRVEFVSTHRNLKKVVDEVYFDELQGVIDEYVERVPEYAF